MYLTATSLVPYLLGRGLISSASVTRGDLKIIEFERNNRCFKVISNDGPSFFVKQIRERDEYTVASLQREAVVSRLATHSRFAALQPFMPRFESYDEQRHALVVEFLSNSENVHEFHNRIDSYPIRLAESLGRTVGVFYSELGRQFAADIDPSIFNRQIPWILSFHRDQGDGRLSPANQQLLQLLQDDSELPPILDQLHSQWRFDGLMHRDLKWNNIAVEALDDGAFDLRILDWEMSDCGDWCWDAGMLLQDWWTFETMAVPDAPLEAEPLLESVFRNENPLHDAVRSFWQAWISTIQLPAAVDARFQEKCVLYAAARILQTVYELMHPATEFSDHALRLFRLRQYLLKNPSIAMVWLK